MIHIKYYKSNEGLLLTTLKDISYSSTVYKTALSSRLGAKGLVNGKQLLSTFKMDWEVLESESEIKELLSWREGRTVQVGWKLINSSLTSKDIPLTLTMSELQWEYNDYHDEYSFSGQYKGIGSLYEKVEETSEGHYETLEFEVECLGEIDITRVTGITGYNVVNGFNKGNEDPYYKDIRDIVNYNELSEILVDPLFLHEQPCEISSRATYNIVRNHIKNTINSQYAKITSDYDFCFEVKKRIKIEAYTTTTEVTKSNGGSYAKPRFNHRTHTEVLETVFKMTHEEKGYQGYPIIEGFKGDSLMDLIDTVKAYLEEITEVINKPLKKCEHCSGKGVVHITEFNLNERGIKQ